VFDGKSTSRVVLAAMAALIAETRIPLRSNAATARYEELFRIDRFGAMYFEHMKRPKMFIQFLLREAGK